MHSEFSDSTFMKTLYQLYRHRNGCISDLKVYMEVFTETDTDKEPGAWNPCLTWGTLHSQLIIPTEWSHRCMIFLCDKRLSSMHRLPYPSTDPVGKYYAMHLPYVPYIVCTIHRCHWVLALLRILWRGMIKLKYALNILNIDERWKWMPVLKHGVSCQWLEWHRTTFEVI